MKLDEAITYCEEIANRCAVSIGYRKCEDDLIEKYLVFSQQQPEIIRCKDCEYYELTQLAAHRCAIHGCSTYGNNFCSWAKRKEE